MCSSTTHDYYDQDQGQLAVCEVEFCNFICWTPCEIWIVADINYFFNDVKPSLDTFCYCFATSDVNGFQLCNYMYQATCKWYTILLPVIPDIVGMEQKTRENSSL